MGYFSNGAEGMDYQARWCQRCVHDANQDCPVWLLHLLYSYKLCNEPDNWLHQLIPMSEDGLRNERCKMFVWNGEGQS